MSPQPFQVFLHGPGTRTAFNPQEGKRITAHGAGRFLHQTFASLDEARDFCRAELRINPASIFYITREGQILDTLLNPTYLGERARRGRIVASIISLCLVAPAFLFLFHSNGPFHAFAANMATGAACVLVYITILWVHRGNVVESMVIIVILFVLTGLCLGALQRARTRRERQFFTPAAQVSSFNFQPSSIN